MVCHVAVWFASRIKNGHRFIHEISCCPKTVAATHRPDHPRRSALTRHPELSEGHCTFRAHNAYATVGKHLWNAWAARPQAGRKVFADLVGHRESLDSYVCSHLHGEGRERFCGLCYVQRHLLLRNRQAAYICEDLREIRRGHTRHARAARRLRCCPHTSALT